jgi:uncharacterized protein YutE (UPF0331/DUF86 family)
MLRPEFVERKLRLIADELARLARFRDFGDLAIIPEPLAQRIAPSAGLRNVLVHEYNDVDHRIVHAAIRTALSDYTAYVRAVGDYIASHGTE